MDKDASPGGKQLVVGGGVILAALLLWAIRDVVPAWAAKSVTATIEIATTTERDDVRATRAFDAAQGILAIDAQIAPLPNQTRVRHMRVTLRAPSETEAIAAATRLANAMAAEFEKTGAGTLSTDVRRRTTPVPDRTTIFLANALRTGAGVSGVLGLALIALGWRRLQGGPDRLPNAEWLGVAASFAVPAAVYLLPVPVLLVLMGMAIPCLISGLIVYKMERVRQAAHWPATRARITRSELRADHRNRMEDVSTVVNIPVVEYEFTLGGRTIRGTHIGIGDTPGNDPQVEATLERYRVGATVPVYYNPKNPQDAVLERDPPLAARWMYAIAAAVFLAGIGVVAAFANLATIFDTLAVYFPEGAFLPGVFFFALAGSMLLLMLWAGRRQSAAAARWPQTVGRIVSSSVESHKTRAGSAGSGTWVTVYQAVVEYSYRVGDRDYHSTQLSFGGRVSAGREGAEATAARYRPGSDVMVRYDPANPSDAVLETTVAFAPLMLVFAVASFAIAVFFSGAFR